jgi:hypothetical protein
MMRKEFPLYSPQSTPTLFHTLYQEDRMKQSKPWCFGMLVIVSCIVLMSGTMMAQISTASIYGIVTDKAGHPLVGASVRATHMPSGTQYGISSRDDGRFNLLSLRVGGPYTVRVTYVGYRPEELSGISLVLGQSLKLDFSMVEEAVQVGEVQVTAERNSVMSAAKTGASMTITRDQIEYLPTLSRSFQDALKMSPLFVTNSSSQSENANGRNNRFNNIQIDGAAFNDLFGLAASGLPGGQTNTQPISLDAIQEVQAVIAPYDVRQSGFTGGGINAITRSGTNTYTGSGYYYGRSNGPMFAGTSPDAMRTRLANFGENTAGLSVGGPIIENKLFFFANGEIFTRQAPLNRTFGASSNGTNVYQLSADTVAKFVNILKNTYGYDPGSFTDLTYNRRSYKFFARLDYNLSEQHRLTLRNNYNDGWDDNTPSGGGIFPANELYKFMDATNSTVLQVSSTFGNTMANELTLGYTAIRDKRSVYSTAFPEIFIKSAGINSGGLDLRAGAETYSNANALNQDIFEFTDNFTYFMGDHTFTIGTSNQFFKFGNLFIRNIYGNYEFTSLSNFANGRPSRFQYTYSLTSDPRQQAAFSGIQYGLYAQDEWSVMPNLKVTAGIRADIPTFPDKPFFNPSVDTLFGSQGLETNKVPSGNILFSPRIGFNYDPTGDRTYQVRGGVGVFSGRIGYVWLSNQYGNTGMDFARFDVSTIPAGFTFQPDPNLQQAGGRLGLLSPVTTTEVDLTDPNFKMPQVLRLNLGVDRQLPMGFVGTIEGIYTSSMNDIMYQDISLKGPQNTTLTPGGVLAGDGRPVYGTFNTTTMRWSTQRVSNKFTNVILMKNTSQGYSANLTVQVQRAQITDGWYANLAYTYGVSKDMNSILSSQALSQWRYNQISGDPNNPALGYSSFDLRHHLIAVVSYKFELFPQYTTTVALAYEGKSGIPFSVVYNGDVNGDGQTSNDLVYIPKDRNDVTLMSGTSATATPLATTNAAYDQLNTYISNDPYLSSHRGQYAERNGDRTSWSHDIDLHFAQQVPTIMGQRFELTFDVLNVLNWINPNWGYIPTISNAQDFLLTFQGLDPATGKPRFVYQHGDPNTKPWVNDNLLSRWQAQVGLRYTF